MQRAQRFEGRDARRKVAFTGSNDEDWEPFAAAFLELWRAEYCCASGADPTAPCAVGRSERPAATRPAEASFHDMLQLVSAQRNMSARLYPCFAALEGPTPANSAPAPPPHALGSTSRAAAADILGSLHSVLQELLLHQLTWPHVPRLAGLLAAMSASIGDAAWHEYHATLLSAALQPVPRGVAPAAVLEPPLDAPPDLLAALKAFATGEAVGQPPPLPTLVLRDSPVVPRSTRLVRLFRVLAAAQEDTAVLVRRFAACARRPCNGRSSRNDCRLRVCHLRGFVFLLRRPVRRSPLP